MNFGYSTSVMSTHPTNVIMQAPPSLNSNQSDNGITIELQEDELWKKFHEQTNEMIVTKNGRRMFPLIKVKVNGLQPECFYSVLLEFKQIDQNRWKYINGEWIAGGKMDPPPKNPVYRHPESPNYGSHWTKEPINFQRVKLTNKGSPDSKNEKIMLNSLHKYEPWIHIEQVEAGSQKSTRIMSKPFPYTQFIAVTAYQNEDVTHLKINHNPFAKAFQQDSVSRRNGESSESYNSYPAQRQTAHLAENVSAYRAKYERHESMDSMEVVTNSNNRSQSIEQGASNRQQNGGANVAIQNNASDDKTHRIILAGVKEEHHTGYVPNGMLHNWPATSTNLPAQSFFDGATLHSIPQSMAVNPTAFDFSLWGGSHLTQHPATGQFYHHHFPNPYHNIHHQRSGAVNPEGHHQMQHQQQQIPQISPTNSSPSQQHQIQPQQLSPILSYPAQISPRGGEIVNNSVPQPAPSSSSHSSGSVNSPPPSLFQSLLDQQQSLQFYPQDHSFGSLQSNNFDGYNRMQSYASAQEQQYPYQSYYQNNYLLQFPNTSSSNVTEAPQVVGNNANSPVSATSTTTLHMPTPPGESSDNSHCKLETVSPGNGNTTLIPLTKVRDYNNGKEVHRQTSPHAGTSVQLNGNFISTQGQVLQFDGTVNKDTQNCGLTFNLPITPPPNVSISTPQK